MSPLQHTYDTSCRLAPVAHPHSMGAFGDTPPIAAQFFYTSLLPIDDPLSQGTLAGSSETKSSRGRLRPFSRGDNNALENAWLSCISDEDGRIHQEATGNKKLGSLIIKSNSEKLMHIVRRLATKHFEKHGNGIPMQTMAATESGAQPATPAALCCPELNLDLSSELQNTFCALARRRQSSLGLENAVQEVMMELRHLQSLAAQKDHSSGRLDDLESKSSRTRAGSIPGGPLISTSPLSDSRERTARDWEYSTSLPRARLQSTPIIVKEATRPRTPTGTGARHVADDGITGTPFARVNNLGAENELQAPENAPGYAAPKTDHDISLPKQAPAMLDAAKEIEIETKRHTLDVVVGVSRLHKVSVPALQMKPIYWSPINDIAVVLRATWFYRDTMTPVPPDVSNQLEAGYRELRPFAETWRDEIRCAIEVGSAGEEKISHRLWPAENDLVGRDQLASEDSVISTDPFCAARCFKGEAAAQGSVDPEPNSAHPGTQHKSFSSYHVVYQDATRAYLLKPSLKPSAYYGRRPVAKIMKGMTIGIPVVRGFDRDAWERFHDRKSSHENNRSPLPVAGTSARPGTQVCLACKAQEDRGQVTDLVLVCHGIGQKFAERVESFHFTHAINSFRREMNLELAAPEVKAILREGQNGIMVLPVNWRHTLSLDDGGPMAEQDNMGSPGFEAFGLRDIEPKTIPAVRSMISDIMFDIPFYMSHHKGKMIEALVMEANRVYRLWCRNNPGFHDNGRVHLIGHSLGSAMAVDILSRQPTRLPPLNLSRPMPEAAFFEFDTKNLFLVGSPSGFFLLLERGALVPRRGRLKPGADPADVHAREITAEAGLYGCVAVDNIYNVLAREDPIAYLLNGTIDPVYSASLKTAYVPSTATSLFKAVGNTFKSFIPGANPEPVLMDQTKQKPPVTRLPSQLELEVHDFTREENAERKAFLLNDNGQIDYFLKSGGGPLEIQYLNMLSAHSSYWASRDFIRMLCIEIGRRPGRSHTIPAMRAIKATKRIVP